MQLTFSIPLAGPAGMMHGHDLLRPPVASGGLDFRFLPAQAYSVVPRAGLPVPARRRPAALQAAGLSPRWPAAGCRCSPDLAGCCVSAPALAAGGVLLRRAARTETGCRGLFLGLSGPCRFGLTPAALPRRTAFPAGSAPLGSFLYTSTTAYVFFASSRIAGTGAVHLSTCLPLHSPRCPTPALLHYGVECLKAFIPFAGHLHGHHLGAGGVHLHAVACQKGGKVLRAGYLLGKAASSRVCRRAFCALFHAMPAAAAPTMAAPHRHTAARRRRPPFRNVNTNMV